VVVVLEQVWLGDVAVMRALMMLVRNEKMLTFYQIYIYIYIYIERERERERESTRRLPETHCNSPRS
jgi:hypothetical protein